MAATQRVIFNVTLSSADTEFSLQLPDGASFFSFQARQSEIVRYAYVTGKVATPTAPFMTLKAGAAFNSNPGRTGGDESIFFASPTGGTVVEVEVDI